MLYRNYPEVKAAKNKKGLRIEHAQMERSAAGMRDNLFSGLGSK